MTTLMDKLLDMGLIGRLRRNHGLEHATLTLLARQFPQTPMAGHSSPAGFWLVGDVPTAALAEAANLALVRMKNGESQLAVHPHCGTNYATSGTLAGVAGAAAMMGVGRRWQEKLDRLALAASLATIMLILSQPLGAWLQRHVTTSGNPGGMEIVSIAARRRFGAPAHQVLTRG